jgi:hypothetical protein
LRQRNSLLPRTDSGRDSSNFRGCGEGPNQDCQGEIEFAAFRNGLIDRHGGERGAWRGTVPEGLDIAEPAGGQVSLAAARNGLRIAALAASLQCRIALPIPNHVWPWSIRFDQGVGEKLCLASERAFCEATFNSMTVRGFRNPS